MPVVLYAISVIAIAVGGVVAALVASERHARRWGAVLGPPQRAGTGAYRSGPTRGAVLRGTPPFVLWTSAIGLVWSALTSLVFAPMLLWVGALSDAVGVLGVVTGVGLVVTGSSGLFLGLALASIAFFVLRRDPDALDLAEGAVVWSVLHHVAGLLFVVLHAIVSPAPELLVLTAPVWVFGLAHAYALQDAAHATIEGPRDADQILDKGPWARKY
jgi:hypothetical protein